MLPKLGQALRKAREKKGLSLEAVARPAGISAAYLHKLEHGTVNNPSPRVLARVATALKLSYLHLMKLAGYLDEAQRREAASRIKTPDPHPLAGQELTREEWRAVGDFIRQLIAARKDGTGKSRGKR